MVEYILEDIDGNQFELSGSGIERVARKTVTYEDSKFRMENRTVKRSYLPGSVRVGSPRIEARNIDLEIIRTQDNFSDQLNELLYQLYKAVYLIDSTNNRRIKISFADAKIKYESGSHKKFSQETFSLLCLEPFWEDTVETSYLGNSLTGSSENNILLVNDGYLETFIRMDFSASVAVSSLECYLPDYDWGIDIADPLFGSGDYISLEIDNKEGSIILSALGVDYDRSHYIVPGSGYFPLPVGNVTLTILPSANCDVDIYFRKRYYE